MTKLVNAGVEALLPQQIDVPVFCAWLEKELHRFHQEEEFHAKSRSRGKELKALRAATDAARAAAATLEPGGISPEAQAYVADALYRLEGAGGFEAQEALRTALYRWQAVLDYAHAQVAAWPVKSGRRQEGGRMRLLAAVSKELQDRGVSGVERANELASTILRASGVYAAEGPRAQRRNIGRSGTKSKR